MADSKISDLTEATSLTSTDLFVIAQEDSANKKVTQATMLRTDGWMPAGDTWTYASSTTFTIAGVDRTTTFPKGTRIKLTQTSAKYFVVASSSFSTDTTVTITGGTDYTLANASITSPFYSYQATPQGYPANFAYTPTYTGFSADPSGGGARFHVVGCLCTMVHQRNDGTSNATTFTMTLPIAAGAAGQYSAAKVVNNGAAVSALGMLQCNAAASTTLDVYLTGAFGAWTASNAKNANFVYSYLI